MDMGRQAETVRRRFIFVAACGLAVAVVAGRPTSGFMQTRRGSLDDRSLVAFDLARAGVERATWEIEQGHIPTSLLYAGKPIPRLDDDYEYRDAQGGVYRVKARYMPETREFVVVATGIESETGRRRALKAVFRRQPNAEALRQVLWQEI